MGETFMKITINLRILICESSVYNNNDINNNNNDNRNKNEFKMQLTIV